MQDHEIEAILQVYQKLAAEGEITPELRAYLTGRLEQLLAPYKQELDVPHKKKSIADWFK